VKWDGTLGTSTNATTSVVAISDGYYRARVVIASAPTDNVQFYMSNADNTFAHAGDGTSTMNLRNARTIQDM
jgi:hypothetical protein